MRKILLTMLTALLSMGLYAQVGINTEDPKASLDIVANTASPTANGLLVPRLTATEVQMMETQVGDDQNALLVYVTATFTASPTDARYTDMDAIGYYYYDAKDNAPNGKWKKLGNGGGNYTAGAGIQIGRGTISATGLERIVVTGTNTNRYSTNDYYAWSLIGRDKQAFKDSGYGKPQYLPLGWGAVDLSHGEEYQTYSPTGASGDFSFASGNGTTASGEGSTAMGVNTTASGHYSTAMGINTTVSGMNSTAMGYNTTASGDGSTAMGYITTASGDYSTAMGYRTTASGTSSVAMGGEWDNGRRPAKALGTNSLAFGRWAEAQGDHSIAMGWGHSNTELTKATGEYAIAMGYGTTASGTHSVAMGGELDGTTLKPAKALGKNSLAFGGWARAEADHSIAMGWGHSQYLLTKATREYAIAIGTRAIASGMVSTAMGYYTTASDYASTAMGHRTTASGWGSTAMGVNTTAPYRYSTAIGAYNVTPTNALLMVGNGSRIYNGGKYVTTRQNALTIYKDGTIEAKAIADTDGSTATRVVVVDPDGKLQSIDKNSFAYNAGAGIEIASGTISATGLERSVVTSTKYKHNDYYAWSLIGRDKQAYKYSDFGKPQYLPLGWGAVDLSHGHEEKTKSPTGASGKFSFASGYGTTASGANSVAMGSGTKASDANSVAMGSGTKASSVNSTAMGQWTTASGPESTAMGFSTTASGVVSIAMGQNTTASGTASTAMGNGTTASGWYSTAMGVGTKASGRASVAMGDRTTASADESTAMGYRTTASADYSTAMGAWTTASGTSSTAMGGNTTASGHASVAMGSTSIASGDSSIAMGYHTEATGEGALACGKYNNPSTSYVFMVGNGTSDSNRKNAFKVWYDGDIAAGDDVYCDALFYNTLTQRSDRRLKKDIATLPLASETLSKLRPVQYHWNEVAQQRGNNDERLQYGFIAQEVEKVLPDLVSEDENKEGETGVLYKSINYIGIIPVLTKALQEKSAIIDEQQSEIEVLKVQLQAEKARNDQQEARLKAIEAKLK